jgi:hypothetical protein
MGLRMPQELSVTRFDDIEIASQFDPPFDNYQRASSGYRPDRCRVPAQRLYGIDEAPRGSLALPADYSRLRRCASQRPLPHSCAVKTH